MHARNILILPAGTEIGLEIFNALKNCKEACLFAAGQDISNHARFIYDNYHLVPATHEDGCAEILIELCRRLAIDYIFPAHDDVITFLGTIRDQLPAAVIAPSQEICEITRYKSRTYEILADAVRIPRTYTNPDEVDIYPVFVKPDRGQGSFGARLIHDREGLSLALKERSDLLICENLSGTEYTIDCFSDRDHGILFAGARVRHRMRNGIAVSTETVDLPEAATMARRIHGKLPIPGAWFFQAKRSENGELTLLEVAPRIAGSMATHRVLGINFPLLSIFEHERIPLSITPNPLSVKLDRALSNRYQHTIIFDALYVDLDDTLLVNGRISEEVILLIFQSINDGKKIILLTRHHGELRETLDRHRITDLFDEVIHLKNGEKKSGFIREQNAILIDDSYSERMDVSRNCNILTFDPSMIELLTRGRR